jgi:hypothetical protein
LQTQRNLGSKTNNLSHNDFAHLPKGEVQTRTSIWMDLKLLICMHACMHFYGTPINGHAIICIVVTCTLVQDGAKILSPIWHWCIVSSPWAKPINGKTNLLHEPIYKYLIPNAPLLIPIPPSSICSCYPSTCPMPWHKLFPLYLSPCIACMHACPLSMCSTACFCVCDLCFSHEVSSQVGALRSQNRSTHLPLGTECYGFSLWF